MSEALTLFDARWRCPRCNRAEPPGAHWWVREEDDTIREVCALCARDYDRRRQKA